MTLVAVAAGVAIAVGVIGTVIPVLPGLGLVYVAMLGYGLVEGFGAIGTTMTIFATLAFGFGTYLGIRIPLRATAAEGLSTKDQLAGLLLAAIGFFAIPVLGAPIGFVGGVFVIRLLRLGDRRTAWRSTRVTVGALVRASLAQFVAAMAMAIAFGLWVLLGS